MNANTVGAALKTAQGKRAPSGSSSRPSTRPMRVLGEAQSHSAQRVRRLLFMASGHDVRDAAARHEAPISMLSAKRRAQKLRLGRRRATHNVKSAFIVAAEVHAGDLPKREIGGAFVPFRIRPDEQKTHPIRFDRDHLADVAHIWVHLLSVNRYQWKSLSSGQQKLVLALKGQLWFSRLPFVSKLQSSLCKVGVGILLQASHIGNSEALKAVEPQTVTHQTKKKELWTDVHHVSPNGADRS